jgi:predicted N-acetyltransferase YhbS
VSQPCAFAHDSAGRSPGISERLREGRLPAEGLSFVSTDRGRLAGTVRLWHVSAGPRPALLLGPLAVRPDCRGQGIGTALMARAIAEARARGHQEILLVGDEPYYARFGFSAAAAGALSLPGPFERHRFLSLSLASAGETGDKGEAAGLVRATRAPAPRLAEASGDVPVRRRRARLSHAA